METTIEKLSELADLLEDVSKRVRQIITELEKPNKKSKKAKVRKLLNSIKKDTKPIQKTQAVKQTVKQEPVTPNYSAADDFFRPKSRLERMLNQQSTDEDLDLTEAIANATKKRGRRSPQEIFQDKYERKAVDEFTCTDLVCFFRYCAEQKGIRYAVNWGRDQSNMKKLMKVHGGEFTNKEIVMMVEFLYFSKQDYLDKKRLSIGILNTNWLNTIYQDADDWVNDRYIPRSINRPKQQREWSGGTDEEDSVGGLR